jgi:hypothetical protein
MRGIKKEPVTARGNVEKLDAGIKKISFAGDADGPWPAVTPEDESDERE